MRIDKEGKDALSKLSRDLHRKGATRESTSQGMASAYRIAGLEITMLINKFEEIKDDDGTKPEN